MKRWTRGLDAARWFALYTLATSVFFKVGPLQRPAQAVLVYLLLVIGISVSSGPVAVGVMVVAGYCAVDFLNIPPYGSLGSYSEQDGILLVGFLCTGFVTSALVIRLRRNLELVRAHAADAARLAREQRKLEAELARTEVIREAERLKNALLASVSHDLRTPLATIVMLADRPAAAADGSTLPRIAEEGRLLTAYLDALANFSRSFAGGVDVTRERHVIDDLVGSAVKASAAVTAGRRLCVDLPKGDQVLIARFDFTLSLRVLVNLIENGARYATGGSPLTIAGREASGVVEVAVCDEGPGVAPNEVEELFRPFRRGRGRTGSNGQGLGLAIARTFARAQGGEVAYRRAANGGSEFVLTFAPNEPIAVDPPAGSREARPPAGSPPGPPVTGRGTPSPP